MVVDVQFWLKKFKEKPNVNSHYKNTEKSFQLLG